MLGRFFFFYFLKNNCSFFFWKNCSVEALPVDGVRGTHFPVEGLGIWKIYQKSLEVCAQNWRFALSFSAFIIRKLGKSHYIQDHNNLCVGNCGLV